MIVIPALRNGAQKVPPADFNSRNTLMNAQRILPRFRSICANEHCLMLQASIICLLLFLVGRFSIQLGFSGSARERSWSRVSAPARARTSYRRILVTGGSGGGGLSLRSDDLDFVVELYTADDFRQLVVAAQTMPTLLRRLRELEDHSECGLVREATP